METLTLPAEMDSLERFRTFVMDCETIRKLPPAIQQKIDLVLEEVVTNQVRHAYRGTSGRIAVECLTEDGLFCLRFTDWGPPFDPLQQPPPDTRTSLEDRRIGGLGIHLVRNLSDRLAYSREQDRNVLTVGFR